MTLHTQYPMIVFCQGFLNRRSLADAITYGKGQSGPGNLQLTSYDNRAQTFFVSTRKPVSTQITLLTD